MSTINQRIVNWNAERNLIKSPCKFNLYVEQLNIIEELIESCVNVDSAQARDMATQVRDDLSYAMTQLPVGTTPI